MSPKTQAPLLQDWIPMNPRKTDQTEQHLSAVPTVLSTKAIKYYATLWAATS